MPKDPISAPRATITVGFCTGFGHNIIAGSHPIAGRQNGHRPEAKPTRWQTFWRLVGPLDISGKTRGLQQLKFGCLLRAVAKGICVNQTARSFPKLTKDIKLPASIIEYAWLKANPHLEVDGITFACKKGHIQEAQICLSRDLKSVPCGQDVVPDCRMKDAVFTPFR